MSYIELKRAWTDDDGMIELEVIASNGQQVGTMRLCVYPDQLVEFGDKLTIFPSSVNDIAALEYGTPPDVYSYVLLKAQVLDGKGHSALEVQFDNRLEPPEEAKSKFFISAEPASLNRFGSALSAWASGDEKVVRAEFRT